MQKIWSKIIILSIIPIISYSQNNLPIAKNFEKAYQKQTRNENGTPGKNYFINYANYTIKANFDPKTGKLYGTEKIIYHNQSPDTLNNIIIRLYKNIFKKGNSRDFIVNPNDINNGVTLTKIQINGEKYNPTPEAYSGTILTIKLPKKLLPKTKLTLKIEWQLTMPQQTAIRNGKYADNVYFVAYWYPQIAVYDDIFGWDKKSYTGTQEFYNDHSNFDVTITTTSPNLVWATGILQNPHEILTQKYLKRLNRAKTSDSIITIVNKTDYNKKTKILKNKTNNWHFVAKKVPDFAFATSNQHNWEATSISMPNRKQKILINGVYPDTIQKFHTVTKISRETIAYYSFKKPQIPYPYPSMTIFGGGGAMEFPMMVNIRNFKEKTNFYYVISHEIGHTYFPFLTGTNEYSYAWMDEGFMYYLPRILTDDLLDTSNITDTIFKKYQKIAGTINDVPIMVPSEIYKKFAIYRNIAYTKPGYALFILNKHLGDSLFFATIKEFTNRWKYKHPYPFDLFRTFEDVTKQNLQWIWKPFFFEFAYPDIAITNVKFENGLHFSVENKGGIPLPIEISIIDKNQKETIITKPVEIWKNNKKNDFYLQLKEKPTKIIIKHKKIPDIDTTNNIYKLR